MREIYLAKVTLNVGCGTTTSPDKARKLLEMISGRKAVIINSRKRTTFNVPRGKPIGAKVTVREGAAELLARLLKGKDALPARSFDNNGNVSFGIKEYIDLPDVDYDPDLGILGFDVCVTLERPGFRVKRRKISKKIGKNHRVRKEEAMEFVKSKFGVDMAEKVVA